MGDLYILDENNIPRQVTMEEYLEWNRTLSPKNDLRRVRLNYIRGCMVSTVFLMIDHRFSSQGPPILFETMIFGGHYNNYQERYCTYEEAVEGHKRAVEKLNNLAWRIKLKEVYQAFISDIKKKMVNLKRGFLKTYQKMSKKIWS